MKLPILSAMRRMHVALLERREAAADRRGGAPPPLDSGADAAWALAHTGLLAELPAEELAELARTTTSFELAEREERLLFGALDRVHLVVEGGVMLVRVGEDGRRLVEAVVDPGGMFGSLVDDGEGTGPTVAALERSRLLELSRRDLLEVIARHPGVALSVVQELDGQRRRLLRRVESLVFKDVDARVVETVLELAREHPEACAHGMALDVRLTQQDLADLVGASRERVNRSLGALQRRAYLRREGRALCIPSVTRLERLARAQPDSSAGRL